jgi:hypothetical protein
MAFIPPRHNKEELVPPDRAGPGSRNRGAIGSERVVSGASPFAAGCPGARFDDQTITGHELEPAITVNPANPRNIVAAWKQDVGTPNQTRSDLVASSLDGGRTWTRSTIPGLTACTGGTADAGSDPWVSAGRDGTVYSAAWPPTSRPTRRRPPSSPAARGTAGRLELDAIGVEVAQGQAERAGRVDGETLGAAAALQLDVPGPAQPRVRDGELPAGSVITRPMLAVDSSPQRTFVIVLLPA